MKLKSFNTLILALNKETNSIENKGIDGNNLKGYVSIRFICLILTLFGLILLNKGFDKDFSGYLISALSIYIGLVMTLITFMFDKFNSKDFSYDNVDEKEKLILLKNFYKKFITISSQAVFNSIICIFLLSISLSISKMNIDIIKVLKGIDIKKEIDFWLSIKMFLILSYRAYTLYVIFRLFFRVIYIVVSSFNYFNKEMDKMKIT
ncbi:Uncharacterised protein [Algoriella xinjiangensis]|uniref:hypothetical protein n=1 Tax=Algoriella xinjiangensis TaxID=684065 RepID=UPI000F62FDEB|nr:hypothetical protein [Algoriella xinjiangensis]VDH16153.1 Uncharacterised protein [Algoriella xinjiangensis]